MTTAATITRDMPDARIVAEIAIRDISPNQPPYFSVTGEVYYPHGTWSGAARHRNNREPDICGCVHGEILDAFPHLAPLVALHLANAETGEPMHAEANARYFWRGDHVPYELDHYGAEYVARHGTPAERAARTLRVPVDALPDPSTTDDDAFAAFVDTLRPQWAAEAAAARALLHTLRTA